MIYCFTVPKDVFESGWWFPRRDRIYLPFNHPGYLEDVKPEYVIRSRELLEKALVLTETKEQTARAKMLMRCFDLCEATTAVYNAHRKIVKAAPPTTESAMLAFLDDIVNTMNLVEKRKRLAAEIAAEYPHLVSLRVVSGTLSGDSWGALKGFTEVADWVKRGNKAVIQKIKDIAGHAGNNKQLRAAARKVLKESTRENK